MKKIKSTILWSALLLTTATLAGSGIYKNCKKDSCSKCDNKKYYKHSKFKDGKYKSRSYHKGDSGRFIIGAIYSLDLDPKQKTKIDTLIKEFENKRFKYFEVFTKDGFNKDAYIKARLQSKESKVKQRAQLIEGIYSVLTAKQKKELKEELNDFKKMRRENNDSSCNGRR